MDWIAQVEAAAERLQGGVYRTPLLESPALGGMNGGRVYLKLESEQVTGSFKARGALNKILALSDEERSRGVVTASSGNHAQGVARALGMTNTKGIIFLPTNASPSKVAALQHYPVQLEFFSDDCLQTEMHAKKFAKEKCMTWVSPYNDPLIIAGQGTVGKEILEDLPNVDAVLVCVGGGGLMSGIAAWLRANRPQVEIIACQPANSPEMFLSVQAGEITDVDEPQETLSDGSAGGIDPDAMTFGLCREWVDDFILVEETEIAEAIRWMVNTHHKIIEGAAGVALGAYMKSIDRFKGKNVAIVICGANISTENLKVIL